MNSRIHHFLPECIAFNQSAVRYFLPECIAPRTTRIKTRGSSVGKRASFAAQTRSFLCGKFSTARLKVFQMSAMVNLGIGFQFKSLWLFQALNLTRIEKMSICSSTPQLGGYTNFSFLEGDMKVRKWNAMLLLTKFLSRKWIWFWPLPSKLLKNLYGELAGSHNKQTITLFNWIFLFFSPMSRS